MFAPPDPKTSICPPTTNEKLKLLILILPSEVFATHVYSKTYVLRIKKRSNKADENAGGVLPHSALLYLIGTLYHICIFLKYFVLHTPQGKYYGVLFPHVNDC